MTLFRSLRVHNFRLFACGEIISLSGIYIQRVAQDWLVLRLADNPGTSLGVVSALQFLPMLLFGPYAGLLADRHSKRQLLKFARIAIALLALAMGVLDLVGLVQLWSVYVFAALLGIVATIEEPTVLAFLVEVVGPKLLSNALSLNSAIFNMGRIIGPASGGILINAWGTGPVFLMSAVSAAAAVVALVSMRRSELIPGERATRQGGQIRAGLRYVRGSPQLLWPTVLFGVVGMFALNLQVTLPLIVNEVFQRGAGSHGLLAAAFAAGSLAGTIVAALRNQLGLRFVVGGALMFGTLLLVTSLMPTYLMFLILMVPAGAAFYTFITAANTSVQLASSATMRGRVTSLLLLALLGGVPLAAPVIGLLAETYGARFSLGLSGAICALSSLVVGLMILRQSVLSGQLSTRRSGSRAS